MGLEWRVCAFSRRLEIDATWCGDINRHAGSETCSGLTEVDVALGLPVGTKVPEVGPDHAIVTVRADLIADVVADEWDRTRRGHRGHPNRAPERRPVRALVAPDVVPVRRVVALVVVADPQ